MRIDTGFVSALSQLAIPLHNFRLSPSVSKLRLGGRMSPGDRSK
jgi:hypothetical protein